MFWRFLCENRDLQKRGRVSDGIGASRSRSNGSVLEKPDQGSLGEDQNQEELDQGSGDGSFDDFEDAGPKWKKRATTRPRKEFEQSLIGTFVFSSN